MNREQITKANEAVKTLDFVCRCIFEGRGDSINRMELRHRGLLGSPTHTISEEDKPHVLRALYDSAEATLTSLGCTYL